MPTLNEINKQYSQSGGQSSSSLGSFMPSTQIPTDIAAPAGQKPATPQQMQQASTASANAETQMQNQTQDQKTTDNRGFWGNVLPVGGQILGGIIGGVMDLGEEAATEGADPTFGSNALAGAGIGQAVGDAAQQGIEMLQGKRSGINTQQIGKSGLTGVGAQAVGDVLGDAIKPAAKLGLKGLAYFANIPSELLLDAVKNPAEYSSAIKGGEDFLTNVVKTVGDSLGKASEAMGKKIDDLMSPIANATIQGGKDAIDGLMGNITKIFSNPVNDIKIAEDDLSKLLPKELKTSNASFGGIKFPKGTGTPKLDFSSSTVVKGAEQAVIQKAYDFVNSIDENSTAQDVNKVLQKIWALRGDMPGGQTSTKAILGKMYNAVDNFVDTAIPELGKVREQIKPMEMLLNNMRDVIPQKAGANMTDSEIQAGKKNLLKLYDAGYGEMKKTAEKYASGIGGEVEAGVKNLMEDVGGAKIGGVKVAGLGRIQPGSVTQATSKAIRPIWGWLAKQAVEDPLGASKLVQSLLDNNVGEDVIKSIIGSMYQKNVKSIMPVKK